jgi:hypothetical protein
VVHKKNVDAAEASNGFVYQAIFGAAPIQLCLYGMTNFGAAFGNEGSRSILRPLKVEDNASARIYKHANTSRTDTARTTRNNGYFVLQ